jgi:hypothetical protein
MEGEPTTNSLTIVTLFKDVKKSLYVEFSNSYEKYVFKTIIYNYLVLINMLKFRFFRIHDIKQEENLN